MVLACLTLSISAPAAMSALDGMQPTLRQVPPSASFSDDSDLLAELREANGTDVASRSGTDDDDVALFAHGEA